MQRPPLSEEALFQAARRIGSPEARRAYLAQSCEGDDALCAQVESLLAAHDEAISFLESPHPDLAPRAAANTIDLPPIDQPGSVIGPYKLVEQIGEGGMGVVFMAEQAASVRRKVALKVIKPGMDTRQVIARFETERQALAIMDHVNIAKIHDAGATESGRPFFVMELVRGVPITDYCDQYKLDLKSRLQLFIDVCRAVQHAHQKGVIHRDIKPTNVLVSRNDAASVPKVIDFGIAKATGRQLTGGSAVTGFKQLLGTPLYMSLEQAEMNNLDVDTRSDVYSLGVLLYELLTGHTPFDKRTFDAADYDELRRMIREVDPPRPSNRLSTLDAEKQSTLSARRGVDIRELSRHLRGELDWIVMKALEKDRARRYASAEDLARDVERYLYDQPVEACPPSAAYRLKKFAKRNKGVLSATCLVAAALLLGTGVSAWQAIRAIEAEQLAEANADESETHRKLAEANADEAETNRKLAEANARQADVNARQAADEAAIAKAVNEFLQQDLLGLADAAAQLGAKIEPDPEIKLTTLLDRALAKVDERFADQPRIRAEVQSTLANSFRAIGRYPEAVKLCEEVREYRETTQGPEHPDTLTWMNNLAAAYLSNGQLDKALPLFEQTLELMRRTLGPEHPDTLNSMNNLAQGYKDADQLDKALPLFEQTFELRRKISGPEHPDTLTSMNNLGAGYLAAGQLDKALPLFEQTFELRRKISGPEHPDTLASMNNLATGYWRAKQLDKSIPLFEETVNRHQSVFGPDHPETLNSMANLGVNYRDAGRLDEALPLLEKCHALAMKHPRLAWVAPQLADAYTRAGRHDDALRVLRDIAEQIKAQAGASSHEYAGQLAQMGLNLLKQQKPVEAEPVLRECLAIREQMAPDDWRTFNARSLLGGALLGQQRYAEAAPLLVAGYEGMRDREASIPPPGRTYPVEALERLVQLYEVTNQPDQAARWRDELAKFKEKLAAEQAAPPAPPK